ncbi:MAG: hydroxyethylthiazole kinase [Desulfovibrionaceae bacterium]
MPDTIDPAAALRDLRAACPVVHNITNFVVMNSVANALLALGASPIMAHAPEEMEEIVGIASALALNIGTLDAAWTGSMLLAGQAAQRRGTPVVLDPVGAGASTLRTDTAARLMREVRPALVRGNASELIALAGALDAAPKENEGHASASGSRGVDSTHSGHGLDAVAAALARRCGCVAVCSGETDIVSNGTRVARIRGGHALMRQVTGMGCMATAIIGAFAAVRPPFEAAVCGMAAMKAAGGMAAQGAAGPGTLLVRFIDALYALDSAALTAHARVEMD